MNLNGRIQSDHKEIVARYYDKAHLNQNNRDEAFLKDLYDTIKSLEAIGREYIENNGKLNNNYMVEKIEFAKVRWDAAYSYFNHKLKEDKLKNKYQHYKAYEIVRLEGKYNMYDPCARTLTGLCKEDYIFVMENYTELNKMYNNKFKEEMK